MANIKKLLESMDRMSGTAKKSSKPKFPGYWKANEPASKSRSRMVGEESVIKELHNTATSTEFKLQEAYNRFKEDIKDIDPTIAKMPTADVNKQISAMAQNAPVKAPAYTGIDPIVRQRMGMQPATQDEVGAYLDKNPQFVTTRDGQPVRSGSGSPVVSGGLTNVGRAADAASPDRERAEAMPAPSQITQRPSITLPDVAPTAAVATKPVAATPAPVKAPVKPAIPQMPKNPAAGSWQDVWKNNPQLKNPNMLKIGQQIKLPNGVSVTVNKGDTLGKLAKQYRSGDFNVDESKSDEKIADRYDADDFDDLVLRVKKLAQKQERDKGPVDLSKLAKKLRALDQREQVDEYGNAQDPNAQVTSPGDPKPSTASQEAQQQQNMKDQAVDMATAKSTTTTLKNVLGPKFDPNAAATAIVKANDGKPMSSQEQQAMGAITPLVMKAAETPNVSGQLKSALQNAGIAAQQGK